MAALLTPLSDQFQAPSHSIAALGVCLHVDHAEARRISDRGERCGLEPAHRDASHPLSLYHATGAASIQRTNSNGALPVYSLYPGTWRAQFVPGHSWQVLDGKELVLTEDQVLPQIWEIRLTRPDPAAAISGTVVDGADRPIPGVELHAQEPGRAGDHVGKSGHAGRFSIGQLLESKQPYRITLPQRTRHLRLASHEQHIEARRGTQDLKIVVERLSAMPIELEVVAAESGAPIPRFAWSIQIVAPSRPGSPPSTRLDSSPRMTTMATFPNGKATAKPRTPGAYVLHLRSDDPARGDVLGVKFSVEPGQPTHLRVPVPQLITWSVQVRDRGGDPIAGVDVDLAERIGDGPVTSHLLPVDRAFVRGIGGTHLSLIRQTSRTSAAGIATFQSPSRIGTAILRVTGEMVETTIVPDVTIPQPGATRVITVDGAGIIEGALQPLAALATLSPTPAERARVAMFRDAEDWLDGSIPELEIRRLNGPKDAKRIPDVKIKPDGTFRFTSIPPGDYAIHFDAHLRQPGGKRSQLNTKLLEVSGLRSGEKRRVVLSLKDHTPIPTRGSVRWSGEPSLDHVALRFIPESGFNIEVSLSKAGEFEASLPAGNYHATLTWREGVKSRRVYADQPVLINQADALYQGTTGIRLSSRLRPVRQPAESHPLPPESLSSRGGPVPRQVAAF